MQDTSTVLSRQWQSRPSDERFTSLTALGAYTQYRKANSRQTTVANRQLTVLPSTADPLDIAVQGPSGHVAQFTHWSFGQIASLAGAPAGYLRSGLPGALIADCLNWGLHAHRSVEDVGVLLHRNGGTVVRAATGPDYGRIWDADIVDNLIDTYGDGVSGDWRVPGEFGTALDDVTVENTTIYGGDRDMWVFLADEDHRVEISNRRNGESGSLARGFYITNSEVGAGTLTLGMFLFDYACCNRILWGVGEKHEIRIRHTKGAPFRWNEEVRPVLAELARTDTAASTIAATLRAAQSKKLSTDVETFLTTRFGKSAVAPIMTAHMIDELRPIETVFDVITGATAYARNLVHVDARSDVERKAGQLLRTLN